MPWLVEQFADFQYPEDMRDEYGEITASTKRKILGLNAARLYDLELPTDIPQPEVTGPQVTEKPAVTPT